MKQETLHVIKKTPDPLAVVLGAVIAILAKLGILSKLDLSAEDVWEIGGYVVMAAAGLRSYFGVKQAKAGKPVAPAPEAAPAAEEE